MQVSSMQAGPGPLDRPLDGRTYSISPSPSVPLDRRRIGTHADEMRRREGEDSSARAVGLRARESVLGLV